MSRDVREIEHDLAATHHKLLDLQKELMVIIGEQAEGIRNLRLAYEGPMFEVAPASTVTFSPPRFPPAG